LQQKPLTRSDFFIATSSSGGTAYLVQTNIVEAKTCQLRTLGVFETAEHDMEIAQVVKARKIKTESMLNSGNNTDHFPDELAQLLVTRTMLYLYAREEHKA
jgi:hypothetical protein